MSTVLVVDDNVMTLKLLDFLVGKLPDVETVLFSDPHAALEKCAEQLPDLVLTDYMMPGIDGLEFILRFRQLPNAAEIPLVIVTASELKEVRYRALSTGATDFVNKPVDAVELTARLRNLLKLRHSQKKLEDRAAWLAEEVRKQTRAIADREKEIIWRLARAVERRDTETGNHVLRVGSFSRIIACQLGLTQEEQELIFLAAPMHDVGKVGIPDRILLKQGRLDAEEFGIMKEHSEIGHAILSGSASELIKMAALIALNHHEKYDGTGYPNRLAGDDIPLCGRIVAVSDVFDALSSNRPYRQAWSLEKCVAELQRESGQHFDPACVEAFLADLDGVRETMDRYSEPPEPERMYGKSLAPSPSPGRRNEDDK